MTLDTLRRMAVAALLASGCAGGPQSSLGNGDEGDSQDTTGVFTPDSAIVGKDAKIVNAADGLHLRTGPSTNYAIILTMPDGATVPVSAADNGWYKVTYSGHTGWCSGLYLTPVSSPPPTSGAVDTAIERAKSGVGFSYHWGGGCWDPGQSHGACYGSCPNCTHSGTWGADCSGYVAKVWQVPGPSPTSYCSHPYSTWNFYNTNAHWYPVSRSSVKRGDAFVYNSGSEGHIFLYDSGDPWGNVWAYECKGCSYGCVHDLRPAYSVYKPIRREGF
jgi:cell wall-associated NlpC family hydrolase